MLAATRGDPPLHHLPALPYWFPAVAIGSSCLFAIVKGGREERIAAVYFALAALAAPWLLDRRWAGTQWAMFAVDLGYLALLLTLAMRSPKWWPIPAAAFQLLAVVTHIASLVDHQLRAWAYVTAGVIWTYLGLAAIVVGTFNHWRGRPQPAAKAVPAMAEPGATRR
ncbi:hypothetical protein [Phenylobacterium sp.]|uniref:hypothetical protein n=1 Tax=Phenylobacterium sp. TaxID=1871053 RepID=UPI002DF6B2B9|nr:hypothetical protein [Phenylobacterium sp.]